MTKEININEVAQGIADVTLELMYDSVDWQLSEYEADGDTYNAIHGEVMFRAIEKMWFEIKKGYYENPLEQLPDYMGTERG